MSTPHTTSTSQATTQLHAPVVSARLSGEPTSSQLLTIKQIADTCQLSEKAIRRAIDAGELIAVKLRSRLRVTPADFDAWVTSSRSTSGHIPLAAPRRARRAAPSGTFRALVQTEAQTRTKP